MRRSHQRTVEEGDGIAEHDGGEEPPEASAIDVAVMDIFGLGLSDRPRREKLGSFSCLIDLSCGRLDEWRRRS